MPSLSNHEPDRSSFDRPVLNEALILRQAQDERRVEGLRTSDGVDWTFARGELVEPLVVSWSNHEPDRSSFDRPVLSEVLILRQAQDERRVEGLRTSEGVDWTFARGELVEPRARPLVLRPACPERGAHPSTGSR